MTGASASGQHKATNENHKGGQPRLDPPEVAQPIEQGPQYQNNHHQPEANIYRAARLESRKHYFAKQSGKMT